ncbi:MAG: hypothetical protein ACXVAZ_13850 [Mucilaginibacter sp.]
MKIWLTSVITGPILLGIWLIAKSPIVRASDIQVLFVMLIVGAMLSSPSLAFFYLIARYIVPKVENMITLKCILSLAGAILVYAPFLIIDNFHPLLNIDILSLPLFIMYSSTIIIGIWLYKLRPLTDQAAQPPETTQI